MLHPSISRGGTVVNGIYPNSPAVGNEQTDPTAFRADQGDVLKIEFAESFALRWMGKIAAAGSAIKVLVNDLPATLATMLTRESAGMALGADGAVTYDGLTDNSITFGGADGMPLFGPLTLGITNFLSVLDKPNSFGLSTSKARLPYLFSLGPAQSISVFKYENNAWVADGVFALPSARDFVATDVVAFKVTNPKIELQLNGVTVWEKIRTWNIALSQASLGTLAPAGPYSFGQSPDLTIGSAPGIYTLGFTDQAGPYFNLAQGITVSEQKAVTPAAADSIMTALPVIAAVAAQQSSGNYQYLTPTASGGSSATAAETTDWGKVLTWAGVGLGSLLLVIILLLAFRKPK